MTGVELVPWDKVTVDDGPKAWNLSRLRRSMGVTVDFCVLRIRLGVGVPEADWNEVLSEINHRFGDQVILRSSARTEDSVDASMSGLNRTIGPVAPTDHIPGYVRSIIASYGIEAESLERPCVIVHRYIVAQAGGVAMYTDRGPIAEMAWGSEGPSLVTSGDHVDETSRGWSALARDMPRGEEIRDALTKAQEALGMEHVEIEWLIDRSGSLLILQARPVVGISAMPNGQGE